MIVTSRPEVGMTRSNMLGDGLTPIAAYAALRGAAAGQTFLLESAPGAGQLARHSVIGLGAVGELVAGADRVALRTPLGERILGRGDVLEGIRRLLRECAPNPPAQRFVGAYGIAAFEFAGFLERIEQPRAADDDETDLHLVVPRHLVVFDHYTHRVEVITLEVAGAADDRGIENVYERLLDARIAPLTPSRERIELRPVPAAEPFAAIVRRAKEAIVEGEIFQIVLSQAWEARLAQDPLDVYRRLRSINPSPYMFYMDMGDGVLLGSSPEMLCALEGSRARLRPLAGTRARPPSAQEERTVIRELRRDPKERAEHIMLVDLGRNDLGKVCEYGSVTVTELLSVERYSHVMHLVSEVQGTLRAERDAVDLFAATFPAGTLSGAPKIRAMQLIAQLERRRRGAYGGSVMRFGFDGSLDACIVLRSAAVRNGIAQVSAGAGIVADSLAEREDEECRAKRKAVEAALQGDGVPA